MVDAGEAKDLPWPLRRVMAVLGFNNLNLRTFAAHPAHARPHGTGGIRG